MTRQAGSFVTSLLVLCMAALAALPLRADDLTGLARALPEGSMLRDAGAGITLELRLSQPVPYRLRLMNDPPRLLVDFREVDFAALSADRFDASARVTGLRFGVLEPGWSRMVLELDGFFRPGSVVLRTGAADGSAVLSLRLDPVSEADFASAVAAAPPANAGPLGATNGTAAPPIRRLGDGPVVVVLDPGHGGIDPGAERDGLTEAVLMLTFARELREELLRAGGFTVVLTRDEDVFVSLEARVRIARQAGADVFLSLHADALPEGVARGATIYTLSDEATDAASAALAERHDRADLLAGVDLSGHDDLIASVLFSMARNETVPRTDRLASGLVDHISETVGRMHSRPRQAAGFSVLKAPDIPSVLIELGFMSDSQDLANLQDADWRGQFAQGIVQALQAWLVEEQIEAPLRRQ